MSVPSPGWEVHLCPGERVVDGDLVADFAVIVIGPDRRRVPELCRYRMTELDTAKGTAREAWQFVADRERPNEC